MTDYVRAILDRLAAEHLPELAYRALEAKLRPPVVTKKAA